MQQRSYFKATATVTLDIEFCDPPAIHRAALAELSTRIPYPEFSPIVDEVNTNLATALAIVLDPQSSDTCAGLVTVTHSSAQVSDITPITDPEVYADHQDDQFHPDSLLVKAASVAPLPGFEDTADSRRMDMLKGLLWQASCMLTDDLFYDLELFSHPDFHLNHTQVLSMLPARFSEHYDAAFTRRFLTAVLDVSRGVNSGLIPPPTIAHALALRALLEQAAFYATDNNLALPEHWHTNLNNALLEGIPLQNLYTADPETQSQATWPSPEHLALDFDWWFIPFNQFGPRSPYASD